MPSEVETTVRKPPARLCGIVVSSLRIIIFAVSLRSASWHMAPTDLDIATLNVIHGKPSRTALMH